MQAAHWKKQADDLVIGHLSKMPSDNNSLSCPLEAKHIHSTHRATLKNATKKIIRKYASLTQAGAFQISTAGSIHFHIGGRGRVGVLANYSSRNDDGKYFEEIEDLACLEMI